MKETIQPSLECAREGAALEVAGKLGSTRVWEGHELYSCRYVVENMSAL
jgi:hypothetical protein